MPTIAVRSLMADSRAPRYQPCQLGWRRSMKDATPSVRVLGVRVHLDEHRLGLEVLRPRDLEREVAAGASTSRSPSSGRCARRVAHSSVAARELGRRDDLVHDAEPLRVGGGEVVAEEDELLRLVHADEAGEQVRDAAVGDEPAAHEHLDDPRGVGRDHEVGREREHRPATGRGAVQRDDHRLLAVEDRLHQPLEAAPHHVGGDADGPLGRALGLRRHRVRAR